MNDELKFETLKLCSGHYLSKNIEDDWDILTEEEQLEFIQENTWEPLEDCEPLLIKNAIESCTIVTQQFIENLLGM